MTTSKATTITLTMNKRGTLIVITGATGVGKTDTAIKVSQDIDAPIVSCDSRQIFKEMRIGTAVPSDEQLAAAEHHFIRTRSVFEPYNCGQYEKEAIELIDKLLQIHSHVILTGGSGLYIDAVTRGFDEIPPADDNVRTILFDKMEREGLSSLTEMLDSLDPDYARIVDHNNRQRIMRALEVCLSTGKPYSSFRKGETKERNFDTIFILIVRPREELYRRIDMRVDAMISEGLVEEARRLHPWSKLNALRTVGYSELFDHFDGLCDLDTAIGLIKRNTRRYAKRQLTWFRRNPEYKTFSPDEPEQIIAYITSRKQ